MQHEKLSAQWLALHTEEAAVILAVHEFGDSELSAQIR